MDKNKILKQVLNRIKSGIKSSESPDDIASKLRKVKGVKSVKVIKEPVKIIKEPMSEEMMEPSDNPHEEMLDMLKKKLKKKK